METPSSQLTTLGEIRIETPSKSRPTSQTEATPIGIGWYRKLRGIQGSEIL